MSLNKSLDRFFDEIRREARRNPDFANRLDAVMRAHASRRPDVPEMAEESGPPASSRQKKEAGRMPAVQEPAVQVAPLDINPVGYLRREGEEALAAALAGEARDALLALVAEHNLDPGGEAGALDRDALAAHVLAQAKRRAERDEKLFDY
jgi:hypothetical protein